jgi:hypothetical protein
MDSENSAIRYTDFRTPASFRAMAASALTTAKPTISGIGSSSAAVVVTSKP